MYKNLRWKILTIIAVLVVFGGLGVYPLLAQKYSWPMPGWLAAKALKLGLDLKGGVQLQMRVNTDDALKIATTAVSEQLRESLANASIVPTRIEPTAATTFRVEGVPQDKDAQFRTSADEVAGPNYNRNSLPGGSYEFVMKPLVERDLREQAIDQAMQTIDRRVNELGVTEPTIARQSGKDQLIVQMPGLTDVARAKEIIRSTAILEFRLVEAGPAPKEELLKQYNGTLPGDMEMLPGPVAENGTFYVVKKIAPVTGQDLRVAKPGLDENNQPAVMFELKSAGATKFGKLSGENLGRYLAIILDNRRRLGAEARRAHHRLGADQRRLHLRERQRSLADAALRARCRRRSTYLEENVVGPSLGADSIRAGVISSLVGLLLIMMFMIWYYKLSGVNAVIALAFNLIILLGLMAYIGATMTLPGIAGFVLTMGMGVDSNVLIFERIKEELEAQRGVRAAINAGFSRVFLTLLDTHVASLIAAAFLFQFGTGPIRGFATTLSIGLFVNLFTSIFVSKTLFELELSKRQTPSISI